MIIYAGDIHGRLHAIKAIDSYAIQNNIQNVIQVGDFAIHWNTESCPIAEYFNTRETGPTWWTCGGNHDNWPHWFSLHSEGNLTELAKNCFYVHRGTTVEIDSRLHLFLGGAESIDRHYRVDGVSWWREETPTKEEFERFFLSLEAEKPEVVVTHDAPLQVDIFKYNRDSNPTPRALTNIFKYSNHHPKHWVFGHHHLLDSWMVEQTQFHCCGLEGEYIIL